jgi:hypothetical protein
VLLILIPLIWSAITIFVVAACRVAAGADTRPFSSTPRHESPDQADGRLARSA